MIYKQNKKFSHARINYYKLQLICNIELKYETETLTDFKVDKEVRKYFKLY